MTTKRAATRAFSLASWGLGTALCLGCGPRSNGPPVSPATTLSSDTQGSLPAFPGVADQSSPSPPWTLADERTGVVTDGVAMVRVSSEVTDGIQRLIVDFDGVGAPPHTTLEHGDAPNTLWLTSAGVRMAPNTVPLLTGEGGRVLNEPTRTGSTPLISYGRVFYPDDSAVRLQLTLSEARPHRLIPSENPRRITVELQR